MEHNKIYKLFDELVEDKGYKYISLNLNLAVGTVKRWSELKKIPLSYGFDIMKLSGKDIDYSKYTSREKDQFYTPISTAKYCYNKLLDILSKYGVKEDEYKYIEPCAGDGSFLKVLPKNRVISMDIEPRYDGISRMDYLMWRPSVLDGKYIVIGNPPFGLRGQTALKFINHSYDFADYVCFILPQLFESDGKGVPRKRVIGYNLVYSGKLETDFYKPDGKKIKIHVILQIWSKNDRDINYDIVNIDKDKMRIYSLSNGGTPSTTRNKDMLYKCDIYLPSTCYGKENMRYYNRFDDLPRQKGYGIVFFKDRKMNISKFRGVDWSDVSFRSTNGAYNIRTSQIKSVFK